MTRDLGAKHTCFNCGTKFYDLRKPEPICPKCGADQRESPAKTAPAPERKKARPAAPPVREKAAESEEGEGPVPEEEADDEDEDDEGDAKDDED